MTAALALLFCAPAFSQPTAQPRIDVAFVLDTTGSMGDEIDVVKDKIVEIARKVASGQPPPDVRFAIVAYRDRGDAYLTKVFPFTRDIAELRASLASLDADGGGDEPEAVAEGLWVAVHELSWDVSPRTARTAFLIGDAGPQRYQDGKDWKKVASEAAEKGIAVTAIGCSGLNAWGEKTFAEIARRTHGEMHHLTYTRVAVDGAGRRRTVLEERGRSYVATSELPESDWKRGADALVREGKLRPAAAPPPVAAEPARNNLDADIADSLRKSAESLGVRY